MELRLSGNALLVAATAAIVVVGMLGVARAEEEVVVKGCRAPLVIFGASMVDVGENAVAQPLSSTSEFAPYGVDYFGRPVARFSNGRVIADFLSQGLGYGLLDPYLNSVDPHFEHGVDFASSGSTARNSTQQGSSFRGAGLFALDMQVKQYKLFKSKITYLEARNGDMKKLMTTKALANGINVMMPAHNDYSNLIVGSVNFDAATLVESVVAAIEDSLRELHKEGARTMVLMNVLPLGCAPSFLAFAAAADASAQRDSDSCIASYNSVVDLHNTQLKKMVYELREELSWKGLVLFDFNAMYLDGVRHPSKYGVTKPLVACCGAGGEYNVNLSITCGNSATVNGTAVTAGRCSDPLQHISWDGLHPTESFAKHIAYAILKSEFVSPHLSVEEACKF